jgi:hypothetical protein
VRIRPAKQADLKQILVIINEAAQAYRGVITADRWHDPYMRNGFTVVRDTDKERLLRTYWSIPERQIETSVVLGDERWVTAGLQ